MYKIISIRENPDFFERAVDFLSTTWEIDRKAYEDSLSDCINTSQSLPRWYLLIKQVENIDKIIGSYGLIENDFMVRKDLLPWFCALFVEENERGKALGSKLLEHGKKEAQNLGFSKIFLCTDHLNYYEKYDWLFFGMEKSEWGDHTRVYVADIGAGESL